jgi:hypothetical protein
MPEIKNHEDFHNFLETKCSPSNVCNFKIAPFVEKLCQSKDFADELKLPDRLVRAARDGKIVPFIGAGVSIDAGVPSWNGLLSGFGLEKELLDTLRNDSLTPAEIARHRHGPQSVQEALRHSVKDKQPTLSHILLAALRCPIYVTTNYDCLFDMAIKLLDETEETLVITNDSNLAKFKSSDGTKYTIEANRQRPLIFKIHGCVTRDKEHLIFTRSDYRRHYPNEQSPL